MGNSLYSQKKAGVPAAFAVEEKDFTKDNITKTLDYYGASLMSQLNKANITPKTIGAAVTVKDGIVYIVYIIAN